MSAAQIIYGAPPADINAKNIVDLMNTFLPYLFDPPTDLAGVSAASQAGSQMYMKMSWWLTTLFNQVAISQTPRL